MHRSKLRTGAGAKAVHRKPTKRVSPAAGPVSESRPKRLSKDESLDATSARLASIYEHSPLAVIEWSGVDLRVAHWSKAAARLFGWRAEEVMGRRADELGLVSAEDSPRAWAALVALTKDKQAHTTSKLRHLRRDGSVVYCEWYNAAIGAKASHRSILSLVLDVTQREHADHELRETQARLDRIIATIPHGFVTIDRQWRYTEVSEHAAREMGKSRDELLGRSLWEVFPDAGDEFRSQCERAWRKNSPVTFEYYSPALRRWYETFLFPFAGGLTFQGYDITERRRTEQALRQSELRLRTVLENTPEGYAFYDAERRFAYINPVSLRLTNRRFEDVIGKRDEELFPEEVTRTYVPQLIRTYETGLPQKFELDTTAVTGEVITKVLNLVPIKDSEGKVQNVVAAMYDLTERKRFERELLDADRRKTEFLALLSHELRNPLTPIRYSLYVLDRVPPGSEQAKTAKAILDRQVDHLTRIVDDLLDVTRISRGKIRLQRSKFDVRQLVQRTVEDYRSLFADKGINLEIQVTERPLVVECDEARIAQVVGNLLQNAAKFTPARGVVSLTVNADEHGQECIIAVRDTGAGISAETLPRLFQPFEQADETRDRSSGGLGLGLALVKSLVEMQGGTVAARSQGLGMGAEFIIQLPLDPGGATDVAPRPEPAAGSPRRVLIVEDNVDSAIGLRDVLQIGRHEVEIAHTGPEALAKARRFRPDVVFCDIGLPGMDGYRVAKAFRSDKQLRSTYLVALTGYALPDDRAKARAAGFDEHVAKPPGLAKLREILAAVPAMNERNHAAPGS
jgi:PAS domain S-box-containing protein